MEDIDIYVKKIAQYAVNEVTIDKMQRDKNQKTNNNIRIKCINNDTPKHLYAARCQTICAALYCVEKRKCIHYNLWPSFINLRR